MAKTKSIDDDEDTDKVVPDVDDMDSNVDGTYEDKSVTTSKKELRSMLKDIQMEDRLKYVVECKDIEECEKIKELCDKRIAEIKSGKSKSSGIETAVPSKY